MAQNKAICLKRKLRQTPKFDAVIHLSFVLNREKMLYFFFSTV